MKIGIIDVDSHNYPNLALMKISAAWKSRGDIVEWYDPMFGGEYDIVYQSKVFSFSPDYEDFIHAEIVFKGGTGYSIREENKKEVCKAGPILLPQIEHAYPDYSLYPSLTKDNAYGFLTRGCSRNCGFCHVTQKEGCKSQKVADLAEFWNGQQNIVIMDANTLMCPDRMELLNQLAESGAMIDFNQGLDIRLMTDEVISLINKMKIKSIHFAWDNYAEKDIIIPRLINFSRRVSSRPHGRPGTVYILTNYNSTMEENLERIYTVRDIGYSPYVMIYRKTNAPPEILRLQKWCNDKHIFPKYPKFEDYKK